MLGTHVKLLPSNLKHDVLIERRRYKVTHRVMCEVGVAIVTVIASHDGGGAKPPFSWLVPLYIGQRKLQKMG